MATTDVTSFFGTFTEEASTPVAPPDATRVIHTKYFSTNPMLCDWMPPEEYVDEVTADQRLGITPDDGCMIQRIWKRRGIVSILDDGREISDLEAETAEANTGRNLPRYNAYDCRVHEIIKTDGPARKERLMRSHEQQKDEDAATMYKTFDGMFKQLTSTLKGEAPKPDEKDLHDAMVEIGKRNPDKVKALFDLVNMELDADRPNPQTPYEDPDIKKAATEIAGKEPEVVFGKKR